MNARVPRPESGIGMPGRVDGNEGRKVPQESAERVGDTRVDDTEGSSATCGDGLRALQELTHVVWLSDRPDTTRMRKSRANRAAVEDCCRRMRLPQAAGALQARTGWGNLTVPSSMGMAGERALDARMRASDKRGPRMPRRARSRWSAKAAVHGVTATQVPRTSAGSAGLPVRPALRSNNDAEAAETHGQANASSGLGVDATAAGRSKRIGKDPRWISGGEVRVERGADAGRRLTVRDRGTMCLEPRCGRACCKADMQRGPQARQRAPRCGDRMIRQG